MRSLLGLFSRFLLSEPSRTPTVRTGLPVPHQASFCFTRHTAACQSWGGLCSGLMMQELCPHTHMNLTFCARGMCVDRDPGLHPVVCISVHQGGTHGGLLFQSKELSVHPSGHTQSLSALWLSHLNSKLHQIEGCLSGVWRKDSDPNLALPRPGQARSEQVGWVQPSPEPLPPGGLAAEQAGRAATPVHTSPFQTAGV